MRKVTLLHKAGKLPIMGKGGVRLGILEMQGSPRFTWCGSIRAHHHLNQLLNWIPARGTCIGPGSGGNKRNNKTFDRDPSRTAGSCDGFPFWPSDIHRLSHPYSQVIVPQSPVTATLLVYNSSFNAPLFVATPRSYVHCQNMCKAMSHGRCIDPSIPKYLTMLRIVSYYHLVSSPNSMVYSTSRNMHQQQGLSIKQYCLVRICISWCSQIESSDKMECLSSMHSTALALIRP